MFEKHYTVVELATAWSCSTDTVKRQLEEHRDLYEKCLVIAHKRRGTRAYRTIRIPESVAKALYLRLRVDRAA